MMRKTFMSPTPTILLFGQDKHALAVRRIILEQAGYDVIFATETQQALQAAGMGVAAAILVEDDTLQSILDLASAIKEKSNDLPVIVLGRSPWAGGSKGIIDGFIPKIDGPTVWLESLSAVLTKSERRRRRILNVDDNEIQRYSVSRMLSSAGYRVDEAESGLQTLTLASQKPDLVLLDVNLPDMNGFEVCRRLKNNPETQHIPILHLSATYKDAESRAMALKNGAAGYLTQPIGRDELATAIDGLVLPGSAAQAR